MVSPIECIICGQEFSGCDMFLQYNFHLKEIHNKYQMKPTDKQEIDSIEHIDD